MSGPWEQYKKPEASEDGPWAQYKQPETPADNTPNFLDKAQEFGSGVMDNVNEFTEAVNPLAPLAHVAGNAVGALLDPDKTYADYVADDNKAKAARKENTSFLPGLAGSLANPLNKLGGMAGVGTNVAVNAANNEVGALALDSGKSQGDIATDALTEGVIGTGLHGAMKVAAPVTGFLKDKAASMSDALALKYGKQTLGGTKKELEKLEIRSDKLDNSVKRLLDENVFDEPFQSKKDIFDKISAKKAQSGEAGGELFTATAQPANQAETYERLMTRAKIARNNGKKEIADKLEAEASIIRDIESKPLDIDQPLIASPDQAKSIAMQNTELSPEIIKNRKTTLDEQAFKGEGDPAARAAADEMRDAQYGLMDPDAQDFLKAENARYGDLAVADKLAGKNAAGEISNGGGLLGAVKKGVLSTAGSAIGGAIAPGIGHVAGFAAGSYASKLLQDHGNQLAAYGFNRTSKVLQNEQWAKTLYDAAQRGGTTAVSTAHFLLTQRDPAYRQAHQADQDASKDH